MENDPKGNENWFELARGSSYRESTVLSSEIQAIAFFDLQFSRLKRTLIPSGASLPIGIFRTLRKRVKTIFKGFPAPLSFDVACYAG